MLLECSYLTQKKGKLRVCLLVVLSLPQLLAGHSQIVKRVLALAHELVPFRLFRNALSQYATHFGMCRRTAISLIRAIFAKVSALNQKASPG